MVARVKLRPPLMDILRACVDPNLFGPFLRSHSWDTWFVFLAVLFGLPLTPQQVAIYTKHTGRSTPPNRAFTEAWLCIGRRGGKSFALAIIAVFLSAFRDWRPYLGPGEVATIMIIAADRKQARVCLRYCLGLFKAVPMLKQLIVAETKESISLRNRVTIEVHTASFRTTRGYTIAAALLDEIAYWPTDLEASTPDIEIINAIRPAMATVPEAMLLCASSPHSRKGALWEAYRRHYAKDGDPILVWQADTRSMNPGVPQSYIDAHLADDLARASAEYLAQFRTDIESFVNIEAVKACVQANVFERSPIPGISYHAFVDPAGGSGQDSMTLCIGHVDHTKQTVVIDCIRERRPPFSPEQVTGEFGELLRSYNVVKVLGDKYAGGYPPEQFGKFNILFEQAAKPKSELYGDLLPMINSQRIQLLDHPRLIAQLCALERRSVRNGRDSIDHPPGAHDDVANSVAGLASINTQYPSYNSSYAGWGDDPNANQEAQAARWQRQQLAGFIHALSGGQIFPG